MQTAAAAAAPAAPVMNRVTRAEVKVTKGHFYLFDNEKTPDTNTPNGVAPTAGAGAGAVDARLNHDIMVHHTANNTEDKPYNVA